MYFLPAERLRLYRNFKSIEINDFNGIIRFFELNEDGIRALDFEECLDCTLAYTNALFEAGDYGKHMVMCDYLLELVIMQNVELWGGEDLYHQLLYKKSISFFRLQSYDKAERTLKELLKIYPHDKLAMIHLQKTMLQQKPSWLFRARAAAVLFALLAVVVIALEILAVPEFYPALVQPFALAHNLLIGMSLAAISVAEAGHALRCWYRTRKFVQQALRKKRHSSPF